LLVGIEIVKEKVVVLDAILQVIYDLLLFVNLDSEASSLIENIFIIIKVVIRLAC